MNRGFIKKTAAAMLSVTLAFGAVSVLPYTVVRDNTIVAHAEKDRTGYYCADANDCTFYFTIRDEAAATISIEDVDINNDEGTVDIPQTITYEGKEYTVTTLGGGFLYYDNTIKKLILPDTMTVIGSNSLYFTPIETVVLPKSLENLGFGFCYGCSNLKRENVTYTGTNLKYVQANVFRDCPGMFNERGAITLNNWLVRYQPTNNPTHVKIADLSSDGVRIDSIAEKAIVAENLTSVDLEGIEHIAKNAFANNKNLSSLLNTEGITELGAGAFDETQWLDNAKEKGIAKINSYLLYYRTDGNVIDLTLGKLEGVTDVYPNTFSDCPNANTLICTSDLKLCSNCFYSTYTVDKETQSERDPMPAISMYKIKNIYLNGTKLTYSLDDPEMLEWVKSNYFSLKGSDFIRQCVEEKTKVLFEQLDIPYYGTDNDKIGALSATEEFYTKVKLHDYIGIYKYDYNNEYYDCMAAFLLGGKMGCQDYADLENYLLECAGVETKSLHTEVYTDGIYRSRHVWNSVKIGDEWFESDDGWNGQVGHGYGWFALSSDTMQKNTANHYHDYSYAHDSWHSYPLESLRTERVEAKRVLGDLNGDNQRNNGDLELLWDYIKGNIRENFIDTKAADINFDGVIDITDGVLLENFVGGKSIDLLRYPDAAVPGYLGHGFKVAYWDTEDTDYIDIQYDWTDADGYIVLPEAEYETPEGKKFGGWDYGKADKVGKPGEKVKISNPYTVIQPVWKNESDPDDDDSKTDIEGKWLLGDVDGSGVIDIGDVSMLINHINGVKALDEDAMLRADVNKSDSVDISDASTIVNHINGVKALEGKV